MVERDTRPAPIQEAVQGADTGSLVSLVVHLLVKLSLGLALARQTISFTEPSMQIH